MNLHLRHLLTLCLLTALSGFIVCAHAQNNKKSANDNNPDQDHVTTVVGDREAPAVSNVLPWRNMGESRLSKTVIDASVLHESLDPLDPDTLQREIQFHEAMSTEQPTGTAP